MFSRNDIAHPVAAIVLVLGFAVMACSGDSDMLPRYKGEPNADDTALQAKLTRDGDCLYLELADGSPMLPVFPTRNVSFDPDAGVLLVDGAATRVGEQGRFLGVGGPRTLYSDLEWANPPDDSCNTEQIWIVGLDDD
jgi:hypothetical protein